MGTVNLKEARKHLGDLVHSAARGESIEITRRGKVVARLVPPESKASRKIAPDLSAFRASLKAKGLSLSRAIIRSRREARY